MRSAADDERAEEPDHDAGLRDRVGDIAAVASMNETATRADEQQHLDRGDARLGDDVVAERDEEEQRGRQRLDERVARRRSARGSRGSARAAEPREHRHVVVPADEVRRTSGSATGPSRGSRRGAGARSRRSRTTRCTRPTRPRRPSRSSGSRRAARGDGGQPSRRARPRSAPRSPSTRCGRGGPSRRGRARSGRGAEQLRRTRTRSPSGRAGTPSTSTYGATSFVTTAPAATNAPAWSVVAADDRGVGADRTRSAARASRRTRGDATTCARGLTDVGEDRGRPDEDVVLERDALVEADVVLDLAPAARARPRGPT